MQVNDRRFEKIKLLGKGKGGYSYLVRELCEKEGKYYVLKQIHHEPCSYYQFGNKMEAELGDYKRLKEAGIRIPEMLEADIKKERILKEYVEGDTVLELVQDDRMKETYLSQVKEMCELLYPAGINIDYFPTNFIVQDGMVWYIDYECNAYIEEWNFENWGIKYWSKTRELKDYLKNLEKNI